MNPVLATGIVLAIGLAAGAINGFLVTGLRLVPFIVTLGTMMVFRGLAEQVAHQDKIPVHDAPAWLGSLLDPPAKGSYQLMPTGAWLVLALAIALAIVMRLTVFGRHVFAIGSNEATARLCGVNVPWTKIIVYALAGFFMALAGIFSFSELAKQGDPEAGRGMELDIIAAVVIGGGSLSGGRGSVLGSIVGALDDDDPPQRLRLRPSQRSGAEHHHRRNHRRGSGRRSAHAIALAAVTKTDSMRRVDRSFPAISLH